MANASGSLSPSSRRAPLADVEALLVHLVEGDGGGEWRWERGSASTSASSVILREARTSAPAPIRTSSTLPPARAPEGREFVDAGGARTIGEELGSVEGEGREFHAGPPARR